MSVNSSVIAVTGLLAEARIAAGRGVSTVTGGGDGARLSRLLEATLTADTRAVISFGIAGGLDPGRAPGTLIVARGVRDGADHWSCHPEWVERLCAALPEAVLADLAGSDDPVPDPERKRVLRAMTGAAAVDMESHIVGRFAARHGLPFAAFRVITDPAERGLPAAAMVGMRPDGSTDVGAVLHALARRPQDLPAIIRTALDARVAFAALSRSRRRLGPLLSFPERPAFFNRDGAAEKLLREEADGFPILPGSGVELPAESG